MDERNKKFLMNIHMIQNDNTFIDLSLDPFLSNHSVCDRYIQFYYSKIADVYSSIRFIFFKWGRKLRSLRFFPFCRLKVANIITVHCLVQGDFPSSDCAYPIKIAKRKPFLISRPVLTLTNLNCGRWMFLLTFRITNWIPSKLTHMLTLRQC